MGVIGSQDPETVVRDSRNAGRQCAGAVLNSSRSVTDVRKSRRRRIQHEGDLRQWGSNRGSGEGAEEVAGVEPAGVVQASVAREVVLGWSRSATFCSMTGKCFSGACHGRDANDQPSDTRSGTAASA